MKTRIALLTGLLSLGVSHAATTYSDATGEIDPGLSTGGGTLDIVGMEVSNTATDINFKLTVNGNVSFTDWGKFMIGIADGKTPGTASGNGWGRPISMMASGTSSNMTHWIGSWVDGGGGAQVWSFDGAAWNGPVSPGSFTIVGGSTSDIQFTVSLNALGLALGDSFWFDAYSSGGGGADSAIDALANPNVSVSTWGDTYLSSPTSEGGKGIYQYTLVPEPSSWLLISAGAMAAVGLRRRR